MTTFLGKAFLTIFAAIVLLSANISGLACGCGSIMQTDEQVRQYYTEKFNGAVFTGKIKAVEKGASSVFIDPVSIPLNKLQIEVDQFWIGIDKRVMTAYTLGGNTSCTVDWAIGKSYFFIATRQNDGLHVGMCDLSGWQGLYPDKEWSDYTKTILGKGKSFASISNY